MGNTNSSMLQDEELELISEETGHSAAQIERMFVRFKSLDVSESGSLSQADFLKVPELAINPLGERVVQLFFSLCDEGPEGRINFRQFMKVLATFRPHHREQKLRFMFKVYDVDGDDLIDIEDLVAILKMMVGGYVDERSVLKMAERTLREADKNGDGAIDFEEFSLAYRDKDIDECLRVKLSARLAGERHAVVA